MSPNPNLEWAFYYVQIGLSIIPIHPGGKEPLVTWKEFQTRKATEQEIRNWWNQWPDAGIAIVTGAISDLFVVDIDGLEGEESIARFTTPTTWEVRSGEGRHIHYKCPADGIKSGAGILQGIDVRGQGGYVVAPPSVHKNGHCYSWIKRPDQVPLVDCPLKLLEALNKSEILFPPQTMQTTNSTRPFPKNKYANLLTGVNEGERHNAALKLAGRYQKLGVSEGETQLILSEFAQRCDPKMAENEVRRVVHDIYERGNGLQFTDPAPWTDAVPLGGLLDEIGDTLKRFVILPPFGAEALALWILHVWALDAFDLSPLLRIKSPTKGCGKTRLLILCGKLLPRNFASANITVATMFRLIDKFQVSLAIDEVDVGFRENLELVALVNSGYTKETSQVPRCVGVNNEIKTFNSWGGKILAGIGNVPDTTESRSITITMAKKMAKEKVERLKSDSVPELERLGRKCVRFQMDCAQALQNADPLLQEELEDRQQDNWRPLCAIADLAGGRWPATARKAALELSGINAEDEISLKEQLLSDLRQIFETFEGREEDRAPSEWVVDELKKKEESPWNDYKRGKPLGQRQLAYLLRGFRIRSRNIRWKHEGVVKGYVFADFEEAFQRYLPP